MIFGVLSILFGIVQLLDPHGFAAWYVRGLPEPFRNETSGETARNIVRVAGGIAILFGVVLIVVGAWLWSREASSAAALVVSGPLIVDRG